MASKATIFATALGLAVAPLSSNAAFTAIGSGMLNTTDSTLTAHSEWTPSAFDWSVEFDLTTSQYRYTYVYSGPTSKGISHFTVETSASFTSANVISESFTVNAGTGSGTAATVGSDGASPNDDDGTELYGMKWNTTGDPLGFTAVVTTLRAPIWADIYIKDGNSGGTEVNAINSGYSTADPVLAMWDGTGTCTTTSANPLLCSNITGWGWVAAPDTTTTVPPTSVPEPGTLLLAGLGVLGIAGAARLRRRRQAGI